MNGTANETTNQAAILLALPAEQLQSVVDRATALHDHRAVDPGLRAAVLRAAEKITVDAHAEIIRQLDAVAPAAVLEAWAHELIPDRPVLGAFPRRELPKAVDVDEWLREDPQRLAAVLSEARRLTNDDLTRSVQLVLDVANRIGIDVATADQTVCEALRVQPKAGRHGD